MKTYEIHLGDKIFTVKANDIQLIDGFLFFYETSGEFKDLKFVAKNFDAVMLI